MLKEKEKLEKQPKTSRRPDKRKQKENNAIHNRGITLIALVITIIVILILARSKY